MKGRLLAIVGIFALCGVALAQGYTIRANRNLNLRADASLQSRVLETVRSGTTLQVTGSLGNWLRIDRNGGTAWLADWVAYSRVESGSPAVSPAADVDNCCFVDRQCDTDADWTEGYWAFQNGQCAAPAQTSGQGSSQPASSTPANVDNCCFVDRQCDTDADWTEGYWAFQNGQCGGAARAGGSIAPDAANVDNCCFLGWQCGTDEEWQFGFHAHQTNQCRHPGVALTGSDNFVGWMNLALDFLKSRSAKWHWFATSGLSEVEQQPDEEMINIGAWADLGKRKMGIAGYHEPPNPRSLSTIAYLASVMLHEACHIHKYEAGIWFDEGWRNELPCHETELAALTEMITERSLQWIIQNELRIIDNYRQHQTWWGAGPYPL